MFGFSLDCGQRLLLLRRGGWYLNVCLLRRCRYQGLVATSNKT